MILKIHNVVASSEVWVGIRKHDSLKINIVHKCCSVNVKQSGGSGR